MGFLGAEGTNVVIKHFCLRLFMKEELQHIYKSTRSLAAEVFSCIFVPKTSFQTIAFACMLD